MSVHYVSLSTSDSVRPDSGTITRVRNHSRKCDSCRAILDFAQKVKQESHRTFRPSISNINGLTLLEWKLINLVEDRFRNNFHEEVFVLVNGELRFRDHDLQEAFHTLNLR